VDGSVYDRPVEGLLRSRKKGGEQDARGAST